MGNIVINGVSYTELRAVHLGLLKKPKKEPIKKEDKPLEKKIDKQDNRFKENK